MASFCITNFLISFISVCNEGIRSWKYVSTTFQLFDLLISNVDYQMLLNGIGTSSINGKPIHNPLLAGFIRWSRMRIAS